MFFSYTIFISHLAIPICFNLTIHFVLSFFISSLDVGDDDKTIRSMVVKRLRTISIHEPLINYMPRVSVKISRECYKIYVLFFYYAPESNFRKFN